MVRAGMAGVIAPAMLCSRVGGIVRSSMRDVLRGTGLGSVVRGVVAVGSLGRVPAVV